MEVFCFLAKWFPQNKNDSPIPRPLSTSELVGVSHRDRSGLSLLWRSELVEAERLLVEAERFLDRQVSNRALRPWAINLSNTRRCSSVISELCQAESDSICSLI